MTDYGGVAHIIEPLSSRVTHGDDDEEEGNYELQVRCKIHFITLSPSLNTYHIPFTTREEKLRIDFVNSFVIIVVEMYIYTVMHCFAIGIVKNILLKLI